MAITTIGELPRSASAEESFSGGTLNVTYSRRFYVQGTAGERERTISTALGVPQIGDFWAAGAEADQLARCIRRRVSEYDEVNGYWVVECDFERTADPTSEDADEAPENRTPTWSWSFETLDQVITKDAISGAPIQNSIGEPLLVTTPYAIPILSIKRFEVSFDGQTILDYVNRTNQAAFWGAAAKQALMAGIEASQTDVDGRRMWEVEYTIKFRLGDFGDLGWTLELLDHGTKYDDNGFIKSFTDDQGNPTTGNLDGGGFALPSGEIYLPFDVYKTADFAALNLGPF